MFLKYFFPTLITVIIAYLLGSINFSIIITKRFGHNLDIRTVGSGNAGATNVMRALGKWASLSVFALDFLKCAVSVLLGMYIFSSAVNFTDYIDPVSVMRFYGAYAGGIACMFGHIYPVFFSFRGGKGVTTFAALIAFIDWRVCLIEFVLFFTLLAIKKIVSLSSVVTMAAHPFITFIITYFIDYKFNKFNIWGGDSLHYVVFSCIFAVICSAIIIIKHIPNIKRIINKTESKFSFHRQKSL